MDQCKILKAVNFDWTMQLKSVWDDLAFHTPGLHENLRTELIEILQNRAGSNGQNPLGQVITGPAGAGKTHFLGTLRQEVAPLPAWFVLVDMTDVKDFWETVLLGYTSSLQQTISGNRPQFHDLLANLLSPEIKAPNIRRTFHRAGSQPAPSPGLVQRLITLLLRRKPQHREVADAPPTPRQIAEYGDEDLARVMRHTLNRLSKQYPEEIREHQDALRALMLLNSNDLERSNVGYSWLQGMPIDQTDRQLFGFLWPQREASEIVKSLSWLMSLHRPTLLAFDQLDAIVAQHHLTAGAKSTAPMTAEQGASQAIIEGIADGLMAIRDTVYRTLTVLACLEASWEILRQGSLTSATDRFDSPHTLAPINNATLAEEIVTLRLAEAYRAQGFKPPYASWPFQPQVFASAATLLPRELLKRCEEHRVQCLKKGKVIELTDFETPPNSFESSGNIPTESELDQSYEAFCRQAPLQELLAEEAEDETLCQLLQAVCRCLLRENPLPDNREAAVDTEFPGDKNYRSLHARVRLMDSSQKDREHHYCFRALQKTHAVAYQSRLNAALTASGIDPQLPFRKLVILRTTPLPPGKVTQEITDQFLQAEGQFVAPNEQDLRAMWALYQLEQQNLPDFEAWLCKHRPATQLQWVQETQLAQDLPDKPAPEGNPLDPGASTEVWTEYLPSRHESPKAPTPLYPSTLPVGRTLSNPAESVAISLPMLTQYTGVLAGSGAGKTVLLKRLVEEAALLGISSIVLDHTNGLASLGDSWPQHPDSWTQEDKEKAEHYHAKAEVIIWTPGQAAGNPLKLEPLPDLASLVEHPEALDQALEMAQATLKDIVAPGESASSHYKMGVLTSALKFFALQGGKTLPDLIAILSNLPAEVSQGISSASRFGSEMAQRLQAEIESNPLFQQEGPALNPALLFGDAALKRPRVSVINLAGLPDLRTQQQFLNQLAMTLLNWITRHPAPPSMPVQGFLVMDEAKEFIPAEKSAPCKENLLRLADHAPTCGLGLIFATQAPKNIDSLVMANCFTQFFGKASAPATIEAVQEQLKMRGGKGDDIPTLEAGHFYFHTEGMPAPEKIAVPWCLSYHPPNPLEKSEVLQRAAASRFHVKDQ
ncbi:ATPase-like protein [Nitrosococcus halophilus Nc 4]|uniref:ATPase-like protein n=1 Tax=Nitrosococcus halophilus (strain Nc4) TaxID=472759 RepID=D5C167_NITHN|nr:DUF87 domain-containing protein [Nitrosococcus halophilus]ADE14624.1 ATPase-like protein [Nitrosococcus halophilus Nc 4]